MAEDRRAQRLRLLAIGLAWPPETFLERLLRGLAERDFEVTVVFPRRPDGSWRQPPRLCWRRARGVRSLADGLSAALRHPRQALQLWHATALAPAPLRRRQLAENLPCLGHFDVLYFPWNTAAIRHLPLFALGIPVVVSCRGAQVNVAPHHPRRQAIRQGLAETFARAAAVHCVSAALRDEAELYGLDPGKARVIPAAVDPVAFQPRARQPSNGPLRLVTTGSLIWRKGYEYALDAVGHLLRQGVECRFEIIGEGPERQRIRYTIDDLGLGDRVRLLGRLPPRQVAERLQQADVFLLASLSEGLSNAALEAMACAVPIVTSDCGGMREAVTDGVEGLVVPMRDGEAMATAIARLAADPALRRRMGAAARQTIERRFRLDRQIDDFAALLAEVATPGSTA